MSESPSVPGKPGPEPDLEVGQLVGEYEVESKIGQGGFGAVFKAVHPLIGKVVAIKVLSRKFSFDPEIVSRFIAEAKAVNQIRNRHIIDIFSFGQLADGRHYYVMEYLDGEPLDALLDREGKLALADALPILRAVARALDAAHAKGIAHRDLKPENVFLGRDEGGGYWPKLLDFGIAKLTASEEGTTHRTRTGVPIGTPFYMSPEQCRGKDVDHRTDYYAFGVVAYQVLTGRHPIGGEDFMAIMMNQISEEAPPASSVNPELPAGVDDVIAWLLQKDPAKRPPSLAAAMAALDEVAEQAGIAVPRSSTATPIPTPPPRSTAPGSVAAAPTLAAPAATAPTAPGLGPRASGLRLGAVIAAIGGAVAVGAIVFFVLHRDSSAPASEPRVAENGARPEARGLRPEASLPPPPPDARRSTPDAPLAAPAPATVSVRISGVPSGTEITLDQKTLGTAPGPIALPRGDGAVELVLAHAGYVPSTVRVVPDRDQELKVVLHAKPRGPRSGSDHDSHDPYSIENPFH